MKPTPWLVSFLSHQRSGFGSKAGGGAILLFVVFSGFFQQTAQAADFVWNQTDTPNDWSLNTNWTPTAAAGGPSAAGTSVLINTNIGGNSTINLYTTGNPGTATKTIGVLDIGDTDGTNSYTIATGTGAGILNFDGNGSNAQLNELSTSKGDTISAPITLSSSLDIANASVNTLTIQTGGITSATAGTKTITTTTGAVTVSGIIGNGSGTVAVVQDGAGTLTLSGTNTFTGGLTIKNGTVLAGQNNSALGGTGTGAVTIGAGSGTSNATLLTSASSSYTFLNPITVAAGGTGLYTIGNSGSTVSQFGGAITLNNNLTIAENNTNASGFSIAQYMLISGGISGSGNLTLAGNGAVSTGNDGGKSLRNGILISGPVSTTGSIVNAGTGKALVQISGAISNAAGGVTQDSATSRLTLSSANTYTGATNVNAGVLRITNSTAISTSSAVNVADGATLQFTSNAASPNTAQVLTLSGHGSNYSTGALESVTTGAYLGNVVLAADATFSGSFNNNTLTVGTVGATTITGSGKNLTTTGAGHVTLSGSLNTGAGTLTKNGTGILTLSGANGFTGLTSINRGTLSLNISTALNGGGNITFGGGTLQYTANNSVDYSSRIINSTGPISIDTGGQNRTLSGGLAASNTGGLTKIGSGTLTLSGTNSYTGGTAVNGGLLAVSVASALPSSSTIFTDVTGALNQGGAYAGVQGWLNSGKVAAGSVGAVAITGNSSENIDFSTGGFTSLMLGSTGAFTYTGTLTQASGTYRLGGGTSAITLSNTNALTSTNALVVGARSGNGSAAGLILSAANNMTGTTTVASGALTLNSATAGVATSDVTVNRGAALTVNYAAGNLGADNNVTRAKSLQLDGSTFSVTGNTGGNSTETITGALTFTQGQSNVVISSAAGKHALVSAGSFVRNAGATVLFAGTSLGVNANAATNVSSTNISFGTAPTLNGAGTAGGAGGSTLVGILTGAFGDTTSNGTGLGTTGGLVTYDGANGVRLLAAGEYKTSITDGQTALDNIRLSSTIGTTVTTTLNSDTTVNSLSFLTSNTGSSVSVTGNGKLKLNSGVIHISAPAGPSNAVSNSIDFNGNEAIILSSSAATVSLSGVLSNTGGSGLTKSGSGTISLSGTAANTFTGTTTVNGGILNLSKTAGVNAINGDLVINNSGTQVTLGSSNQIADTSNVTINGGLFVLAPSTGNNGGASETINNLTMINGGNLNYGQAPSGPTFTVNGTATVSGGSTLFQNDGGQLLIGGLTSLSDGGTLTVKGAFSPTNIYDGIVTLTGGLNITNTATGAYTPVTINYGDGSFRNGGLLNLNGDLTFTGNASNLNTTTIDGITGSGARGILALGGVRTFNVGDGAAGVDLTINAPTTDGSATGGLVKTGAGTLALTSANAYTGTTTVSNGKLLINGDSSVATGNVSVAEGATLGGSGIVGGATTISGIHAPGGSVANVDKVGKQTFDATGASTTNLTYASGSIFEWDLNANKDTDNGTRGIDFDAVDVSGTLTVTSADVTGAIFRVVLGSSVFADSFWQQTQTWSNIFTGTLSGSGFNTSLLQVVDTNGAIYNQSALSSGSGFGFSVSGTTLTWSAVPEPTSALAGVLLAAGLLRRRRA